jgi:predicted site-specific integrase-resolvase
MMLIMNTKTEEKTERLWNARDVAKKWGISYWSLRAMVESGKIRPIIGIGKGWKFTGNEISEVVFERL